jgi:hypothetical protein
MGGGGSAGGGGGAGAPYDLLGGQYANFSGGTPSGINFPGVLSDVGTALQSIKPPAAAPIPAFQLPQYQPTQIVGQQMPLGPIFPAQQPVPPVPSRWMTPGGFSGGPGGAPSLGVSQGGQSAAGGPDVMQLIQRLLG